MGADLLQGVQEALAARQWPPTTPFTVRLGELRQIVQERCDQLPVGTQFVPRVAIPLRLPLT